MLKAYIVKKNIDIYSDENFPGSTKKYWKSKGLVSQIWDKSTMTTITQLIFISNYGL